MMGGREFGIHIWHHCHHCRAEPIAGVRFHCETCPDGPHNDLCEACFELFRNGAVQHPGEEAISAAGIKAPHRFSSHEGRSPDRYHGWQSVLPVEAPSPAVPVGFLVRPIYTLGNDFGFGGYAFVVAEAGELLILTALHTLDEIIKKKGLDCTVGNAGYSGRELPQALTGIDLFNLLETRWMMHPLGDASGMLILPEARTGEEEPYSDRDIAAFRVGRNQGLMPGKLADRAPRVGEPVWIAVAGTPERTMRAVTVEIDERCFIFKYAGSGKGPLYTSGAPILNALGEVVGINVGRGCFEGNKLGHANHLGNIRRHLRQALEGGA